MNYLTETQKIEQLRNLVDSNLIKFNVGRITLLDNGQWFFHNERTGLRILIEMITEDVEVKIKKTICGKNTIVKQKEKQISSLKLIALATKDGETQTIYELLFDISSNLILTEKKMKKLKLEFSQAFVDFKNYAGDIIIKLKDDLSQKEIEKFLMQIENKIKKNERSFTVKLKNKLYKITELG